MSVPGPSFRECLRRSGFFPFRAAAVKILQLNITRRCNLRCRHCHVEAGPEQGRQMADAVLEKCLEVAALPTITTLDVTGGAPELHPRFRELVVRLATLGKRLLVRTNLVVLQEPEFADLVEFYARHRVELVASLPDARGERTDRLRGPGVFAAIIAVMRRLNAQGYGRPGSGLVLDLVHNPVGAYLPGEQGALEADYRRVLAEQHEVEFNNLFCLTNCPVGRYLEYLQSSGNLGDYMLALQAAYNPAAAGRAMCRETISVSPDGTLYDCDFNQMLDLPLAGNAPADIFSFDHQVLAGREIVIANHCFACTAGAGSSCQGATLPIADQQRTAVI